MIVDMKPLSIVQAKKIAGDLEEKKELKAYFKKFEKISWEKGEKLAEELRNLGNLKLKEEYLIKIVDFLPKNAEDLNKIFIDISLDDTEANDILNITQRY